MRLRLASLTVLLFATAAAHADTVSFTLLNPTQNVTTAGSTLLFNATVSAPVSNTGSEDLNELQFNINPANMFTINAESFLNNYPLSLAPGQSYSNLLFTLLVPSGSMVGPYVGTVNLIGGPLNTQIGSQTFTVNVASGVAVTPEPSSLVLLGTGLVGLAATYRRRLAVTNSR